MILDNDRQTKILTPNVQRLLSALHGEARVVGGAVRDVILGRKVGDVDLATTLPPDKATEMLALAGIRSEPTGIDHGTITAILDHTGYEITTLRRDVETDGRHAKVVFTDDWKEDAARRDFTMNALYVDSKGTVYDYYGGIEDAAAGRVRFIGDAKERIREDVLRILRYFRFFAYFGKEAADKSALDACRDLAALVPNLSVERIAREFIKLLGSENPLPALRLMIESGVLPYFLAEGTDVARLEKLIENENKFGAQQPPLARFSAILPQDENISYAVARRLKLSNHDTEILCALAGLPKILHEKFAPAEVRALIYRYGADNCRIAAFLNGGRIAEILPLIASWKVPSFPIRGEDVIKLGVPEGREVGEMLQAIEQWWVAGDFKANRAACLKQIHVLKDAKRNHK